MKLTGINKSITKEDTNLIKGVGILLIMLHNFFHIIVPTPVENEFSFSFANTRSFIDLVMIYPARIFQYVMAFFGHYGVELFVFISGYGLYLSYKRNRPQYFTFVKCRIKKLYPVLILAICLVMALDTFRYFFTGEGGFTTGIVKSYIYKLIFIQNFIPGEAFTIYGPWWFFSLIVQLYLIFPFLFWLKERFGSYFIMLLGLLFIPLQIVLNPIFQSIDLNLRALFIGHMDVFCLGLFFASRNKVTLSWPLIIFAFIIFIWSNFDEYIWYLSFLSITVIQLSAILLFRRLVHNKNKILWFFQFAGIISFYLFATHATFRRPLADYAFEYNNTLLNIVFAILFMGFSFFVAIVLRWIERQLKLRTNNFTTLNLRKRLSQ